MDSRDISLVVCTPLEDAGSAYVVGFYPAEKTLDDKFHVITVNVGTRERRIGRFCKSTTGPGISPAPSRHRWPKASLDGLLRNPLDGSAIGITAVIG